MSTKKGSLLSSQSKLLPYSRTSINFNKFVIVTLLKKYNRKGNVHSSRFKTKPITHVYSSLHTHCQSEKPVFYKWRFSCQARYNLKYNEADEKNCYF